MLLFPCPQATSVGIRYFVLDQGPAIRWPSSSSTTSGPQARCSFHGRAVHHAQPYSAVLERFRASVYVCISVIVAGENPAIFRPVSWQNFVRKMLRDFYNIFETLAKWWNINLYDQQTKEKIAAKVAFCLTSFSRSRLVAAMTRTSTSIALFPPTRSNGCPSRTRKKFRLDSLDSFRQFRRSIKVPLSGRFKFPNFTLGRTGERTFFVSKKVRFPAAFLKAPAQFITNEGAPRSRRGKVDASGHQFFSHARFASYQNRCLARMRHGRSVDARRSFAWLLPMISLSTPSLLAQLF